MGTEHKVQKSIPEVLFVGADPGRREQFNTDCRSQITRLHFANSTDDASTLLIQKPIDLLVLDLASFSRTTDVRALGELINQRAGMETLALCPAVEAGWLLSLMPYGLKHYCLSPYLSAELTRRLEDMARTVDAYDMTQRLDDLGDIVDLNDSWLNAMGYSIDEVIGTRFADYVDKKSRAAVERALITTSSNPSIDTVVCQLRRKNGSILDVSLTGLATYNAHGEHLQTHCDLRGVNYFLADKRKSQSLLEVERELKVLLQVRSKLQQALMGIKDVNELSFLMCHELRKCPGIVGVAFLHKDANEVMQLDACMSRDDEQRSNFVQGCEQTLQSVQGNSQGVLTALTQGEFVIADSLAKIVDQNENRFFRAMGIRTIVGTPIVAESIMFDEDANTIGALCLMLDRRRNFPREWLEVMAELGTLASFGLKIIEWGHEKAGLMRQLRDMAMTDTLTGAANRRSANEFMEKEYARSQQENVALTLIMMDVDKFKTINDTYGHEQGDEVLKAITRLAKSQLRETDLLVRWGGEEFLVVAPNTNAESGFALAEAIRREIEQTAIEGCNRVTVSMGVSQITVGERIEGALGRADTALYRAKESGRNRSILAERMGAN
jgi:diguanylate cyclase (GGDEF)-like protein/PAS domain S-box-containing protein